VIHFTCKTPGCNTRLIDGFSPVTMQETLDAKGFGKIVCHFCGNVNYVSHSFLGDEVYSEQEYRDLNKKKIEKDIQNIREQAIGKGQVYEIGVDELPAGVEDPQLMGPTFHRMLAVVLAPDDVRYVSWDESGQMLLGKAASAGA
jgi:hypothetical protein